MDEPPRFIIDQPGHPVAIPCLREHCQYADMVERLIEDYSYRARLTTLEHEVHHLRHDRALLDHVRRQLQVLASEIMSGPPRAYWPREKLLARLTEIGL